MAINNMALDASEQRRTFTQGYGLVVNGVTLNPFIIPFDGKIEAIKYTGVGISGAPTYAFAINRFVAGSGATIITGGATTLTASAVGTSGPQSFVIASGSTLLDVLANDVIQIVVGGGTGAAMGSFTLGLVVKATQDVKTQYGV